MKEFHSNGYFYRRVITNNAARYYRREKQSQKLTRVSQHIYLLAKMLGNPTYKKSK